MKKKRTELKENWLEISNEAQISEYSTKIKGKTPYYASHTHEQNLYCYNIDKQTKFKIVEVKKGKKLTYYHSIINGTA